MPSYESLEDTIPLRAYDLIEWLDKAHPSRCPTYGESLENIHRYAGLRSLIDDLVEWMHEEQETARETSGETS